MLKKREICLRSCFFFVFLHQLKLNKRNMRKLSCVAFVGLFVLSLLSCSQDDAKECVSENTEFSSCTEEYCQAKKRIKSFLSDMQEAVDENGNIDVLAAEKVVISATGRSGEELIQMENMGITRNYDACLTEQQQVLLDEFTCYMHGRQMITDKDIAVFKNKCSGMSECEKGEFVLGLISAKLLQDALWELQNGTTTRLSWGSVGDFACNAVTGGIGTIWGEMAGGIALACGLGPVGIGVATVSVALIGSAALGTVAC